ncbi:MAG: outer membrane beta-barrel protein [Lutibacter sp.]|uniref:outer membrane beta-barrel protein n=1 Tax=Lutibacter sp. TaxID=1925666 RepID=UPI0019F334E6|nr:outer membrane beta-barrel protein [Lutibacter sp.]NOR28964.1 outer membrane beta-barrel protein [Lutibacter sp.]
MRDLKNIDRLFQENLKDFEVSPPNKAWNAIEKKLEKPSKKRFTPLWVKISSIAALFALLFTVGTIYLLPSNNLSKNILPVNNKSLETSDKKDSAITSTKETKIKISTKKPIEINSDTNIAKLTDTTEKTSENSNEETLETKKELNSYSIASIVNVPQKNTKNTKISNKEFLNGKLTVATVFAPIYVNSFGDGSGVDSQFKSNPTSGNSSYSYGVKIAYKLNNKFSVQSGVNLINLGYTTNDIYVTPGVSVLGFSNLSSDPILSKNETISTKENENSGSLNQVFGYVEIPVEIKYNVANGKLGVNLVGGFSTLLLNKDEVFVETNNFSQSLGSSNNLRSINFSGNIGLDVDYSIRKNLYINVSPMFKIQTNTFSKNSGSIQPYYLGVYTGLNYKF